MPPPRVCVVALRTADLARSTAFYVGLGRELSPPHGGEPTGEAVLSIHVASDAEVDAALQEAAGAGGRVVKGPRPPRWAGRMGASAGRTDAGFAAADEALAQPK